MVSFNKSYKKKSLSIPAKFKFIGVIQHNVILEKNGNAICQNYIPGQVEGITQAMLDERVEKYPYLRNKHEHNILKADLIEHAWSVRIIRDDDTS